MNDRDKAEDLLGEGMGFTGGDTRIEEFGGEGDDEEGAESFTGGDTR